MSENFSLSNETKATIPLVAFEAIKNEILGHGYLLSLVITSPDVIKKLNTIYRNIKKSTDILSFPLSNNEGEIYISLIDTKKQAKYFDRSFENFLAFLFIHGCVHLKGYDHGSTMEAIEVKIRHKFAI